jgi:hypothetical protein
MLSTRKRTVVAWIPELADELAARTGEKTRRHGSALFDFGLRGINCRAFEHGRSSCSVEGVHVEPSVKRRIQFRAGLFERCASRPKAFTTRDMSIPLAVSRCSYSAWRIAAVMYSRIVATKPILPECAVTD